MKNTVHTRLLFELSKPGLRGASLPASDVPEVPLSHLLPEQWAAQTPPALPELGEPDIVRHYTNLSQLNMSVDTHFYPLGSCTMKYNPKRNERLASLSGLTSLHPYQPDASVQGLLAALYGLQEALGEIAGLPAVSLQPAAGAHGELTALLVASAYFRQRGEGDQRKRVLIPDSAHGTNPASAITAGLEAVTVKSTESGGVDLEDLQAKLDDRTAVFMITNPNTVGLFEQSIAQIAEAVHSQGGLIYLDGANMNAILGVTRPGDFGADMMHYNLHKTFSGPHGGGGPGAGPIAVRDWLGPYLPAPVIVQDSEGTLSDAHGSNGRENAYPRFRLDFDRPLSIGRMRTFFGSIGVLLRAYCYILTHGPDGLRRVSEHAVLNANYLLARVKELMSVPHGDRCLHEFVASAAALKKEHGITAMDLAKGLLDHGFHAPTVYFPMIVPEALMMEPTETESRQTLDAFVEALAKIIEQGKERVAALPESTTVSRPDEVHAARQPILSWKQAAAQR